MSRILEAVFRHPRWLLTLIVLLPLMSLAIAFILPPSYQATARLWALRRYETIGVPASEIDPTITLAETQASALSELLQTRVFALSVAHGTALVSTLHLDQSVLSNAQLREDALYNEISNHVQVTAQGNNLFIISYTNQNPQVAQQVVAAVIQNYAVQSQKLSSNQETAAQSTGGSGLFKVQDAPLVPKQPVSRRILLFSAGGIGLAVALLACALYIIILTRRDHAIYTAQDINKVTNFPVIMQIPHLETKAILDRSGSK